jgi:septal ring factor EnvC (AmiA/AmiB activator)
MPEPEIVAPVAALAENAPAPVADVAPLDIETLKKELADVRKEAAKYRTTLRSQEQAQADADAKRLTEAGEFKALYEQEQASRVALEAQVAAQTHGQAQLAACLSAGLPPTMAARLVGATAEELAADATALAVHFKVVPPALGASNPATQRGTQQSAPFDPKHPPRLSSIDWKT